jgi:hypothetical protein
MAVATNGRKKEAQAARLRTHLTRLPLSSVLRREGAARRDPCGVDLPLLLLAAAAPGRGGRDGVVGVKGSGFAVMLDLPLSVLEPVMELKRELSSARGIVGEAASRAGTKKPSTVYRLMGGCHSTSRALAM